MADPRQTGSKPDVRFNKKCGFLLFAKQSEAFYEAKWVDACIELLWDQETQTLVGLRVNCWEDVYLYLRRTRRAHRSPQNPIPFAEILEASLELNHLAEDTLHLNDENLSMSYDLAAALTSGILVPPRAFPSL